MENKNVKYLLAFAVLAIWGLLGYRIYQKLNPGNDFFIPPPQEIFTAVTQTDSFTLLVNYRDPFLGTKLRVPEVPVAHTPPATRRASTVIPKPVSPPQVKPFPQIQYKGLIALKTGRKAALVNIDGKTMNWGWGESYRELTLLNIYEDSIRVRYGKAEKVILKGRQ